MVDVGLTKDDAIRDLLLGFESLGADCEFGLVQRRFGAEPLGLLRWSAVQLPGLQLALAARFAGMGTEDTTLMSINASNMYFVCDARWGLGMHTFVASAGVDSVTLLPKMRRRVAFLRDKLIDDLQAGAKTFVWKDDAIDLEGLKSLHQSLSAFGPVRLINVRVASLQGWAGVNGKPGTTAALAPRLHVGWLSQRDTAFRTWDIAFEHWFAICRSIAAKPADV